MPVLRVFLPVLLNHLDCNWNLERLRGLLRFRILIEDRQECLSYARRRNACPTRVAGMPVLRVSDDAEFAIGLHRSRAQVSQLPLQTTSRKIHHPSFASDTKPSTPV